MELNKKYAQYKQRLKCWDYLKIEKEGAYLAGLLHDIGKLVINLHKPEEYEKIIKKVDEKGENFMLWEEKVFNFTHIDTGYYLVNKWNFPEFLKKAILFHHYFISYAGEDPVLHNLGKMLKLFSESVNILLKDPKMASKLNLPKKAKNAATKKNSPYKRLLVTSFYFVVKKPVRDKDESANSPFIYYLLKSLQFSYIIV